MEEKEIYTELHSIRNLMERSAKFISLSGLSGIMAGIYALIGAGLGYYSLFGTSGSLQNRENFVVDQKTIWNLFYLAMLVLLLSLATGIWLTIRKTRKKNQKVWNPASKNLLISMAIPLSTGGLFILILLCKGYYEILAPASLLFYGLSLVAASHYTFTDVKWLGILEILLGLCATMLPDFGIVFWSIGFGILHIVYGSIMHFKYEK